MENKSNYPVKYAVMAIRDKRDLMSESIEVVANIVSKCYAESEIKKYYKDGTEELYYNVVFPIEKDLQSTYKTIENDIPKYNGDNECYNSTKVDMIYDYYEDAKIEADERNIDVLLEELDKLPLNDNKYAMEDRIKMEYMVAIEIYQEMENEIQEALKDLDITINRDIVNGSDEKKRIKLLNNFKLGNQ